MYICIYIYISYIYIRSIYIYIYIYISFIKKVFLDLVLLAPFLIAFSPFCFCFSVFFCSFLISGFILLSEIKSLIVGDSFSKGCKGFKASICFFPCF